MTYFGPALDPPLGGSGRKTTTLVRDHEYFIPTKFHQNPSSGFGEKVENVKSFRRTDDDGRTDDGRCAMTIAHSSLRLRWAKNDWIAESCLTNANYGSIFPTLNIFLAHLSQRLKWAIVIAHRPSSVRPSVRSSSSSVNFHILTSSPEPLDGFWWNLVCMKYSWSLTSVVFSARSTQGWIQDGAKIGHRGSPSSRNFFFRHEDYSDKPNAWQWPRSM